MHEITKRDLMEAINDLWANMPGEVLPQLRPETAAVCILVHEMVAHPKGGDASE